MSDFPVSKKPIPEIDLTKVTHKEWRGLFDSSQSEEVSDGIVSRCSGLSVDEIGELNVYDYRALLQAMILKFSRPLDNDVKN